MNISKLSIFQVVIFKTPVIIERISAAITTDLSNMTQDYFLTKRQWKKPNAY